MALRKHATENGKPLVDWAVATLEPAFAVTEGNGFDFDPASEMRREAIRLAMAGIGASDDDGTHGVAFCPCDEPFPKPDWIDADHWRRAKHHMVTRHIRGGDLRAKLNAFVGRPIGYHANKIRAAAMASFRDAYARRMIGRMNPWLYSHLARNFPFDHFLWATANGDKERAETIGRLIAATARNQIIGMTMGEERRWIALCR
jgi:hypothetical protein